MDFSSAQHGQDFAEQGPPTGAALGALRAVLAAAERLGVGRGPLLAAAEAEAVPLDEVDRAVLASLRPPPLKSDEFLTRVRAAMARLVAEGRFGVDDVARELAISARTLQRRLERCGTTFGEICDQSRCDAALTHLRNPRLPIKETAFLLGFSEPSTFYRAFRRWTGDTPANYRRTVASAR